MLERRAKPLRINLSLYSIKLAHIGACIARVHSLHQPEAELIAGQIGILPKIIQLMIAKTIILVVILVLHFNITYWLRYEHMGYQHRKHGAELLCQTLLKRASKFKSNSTSALPIHSGIATYRSMLNLVEFLCESCRV